MKTSVVNPSPGIFAVGIIMLFVVPALTIAGGIWTYSSTSRFIATASHASGKIVGDQRVRTGSDNKSSYYLVYQFTDAAGTVHQKTSNVSSSLPVIYLNDSVDILYSPSDPDNSRINGFLTLWGPTLALAISTVVFAAIGLFLIFARTRLERKRRAKKADA